MNRLARLHRYLSCLVAPLMMFFAVSGAWQAFRLHQDRKDGSYHAPAALHRLSQIHMAERLPEAAAIWFKLGQVAIAAAFFATATIGIAMALRRTRPVWIAWVCLLAGSILPALLVLAS